MAAALDAAIPVPHFLGMFGSHEALRSPDASPAANRGPALEGRGDQGHEDHGNLGSKATTNHVSGSLLCKAQSQPQISGCLAPDRMAAAVLKINVGDPGWTVEMRRIGMFGVTAREFAGGRGRVG